jgi:hypothetical protein
MGVEVTVRRRNRRLAIEEPQKVDVPRSAGLAEFAPPGGLLFGRAELRDAVCEVPSARPVGGSLWIPSAARSCRSEMRRICVARFGVGVGIGIGIEKH